MTSSLGRDAFVDHVAGNVHDSKVPPAQESSASVASVARRAAQYGQYWLWWTGEVCC